ncbi:hypothetical protein EON80_23340 [bacterium]|nr:MAG: hypothetical protein EON80_23340 [bacterium]
MAFFVTMMRNPNTLFGLSDGGAHVGAICDVSVPTYMLSHWCRDRTRGDKLDLPFVNLISGQDEILPTLRSEYRHGGSRHRKLHALPFTQGTPHLVEVI